MILNVYKPKHWTSFDVVAKLKGVLGVRKIGHAGTLDPLAKGILIVLTDKDTKKQDQFMNLKKEYKAKVALGATSLTDDLEGKLSFVDEKPTTLNELTKKLNTTLPKYIGEVIQKVPAFSAVKVKGKRLYKEARKNPDIKNLPERKVMIYEIKIDNLYFDFVEERKLPILEITVACGKGVYIRSLARDIGAEVCGGGVLLDLVRTRIGNYDISSSKEISYFIAHQ